MWVATSFGFFSVVRDLNTPDLLMVRARVREDLEEFLARLPRRG